MSYFNKKIERFLFYEIRGKRSTAGGILKGKG